MYSETDDVLSHELDVFYKQKVFIPFKDLSKYSSMIKPYILEIREGFHGGATLSDLKFSVGSPMFSGSKMEKCMHVDSQQCHLIFPLLLSSLSWECRRSQDNDRSYCPLECFLKSSARSKQDQDILLKYGMDSGNDKLLDPKAVKQAFRLLLEKIMNKAFPRMSEWHHVWGFVADSPVSPAVILKVWKRFDPSYIVDLHIVPALQLRNRGEVTLLLPNVQNRDWFRSYCREENELVTEMDRDDGGCRSKILKTIKYLVAGPRRATPLSLLDPYTIKNAVMNLQDKVDWHQDNLAWCFRNILMYLEMSCWQRELPRYFEPEGNIMNNFNKDDLEKVDVFLEEIRENDDYLSLLRD